MTLAGSPTVVGTPLNKANLLTDATAALLGLTMSWHSASTSSAVAGAQFHVEGAEYPYFSAG